MILIDGKGQGPGPTHAKEPLGDSFYKITNEYDYAMNSFDEFRVVFKTIEHRNTQGREDKWLKANPELGKELWELDVKVEEFLKKEEIPTNIFWSICNFPLITEDQFNAIRNINPEKFLNGELDKTYTKLNQKTRDYLRVNLDMVHFLVKMFNSYGQKKWIN